MTFKGSAGPWAVTGDDIRDAARRFVARVFRWRNKRNLANAAAIAQVPEMVELVELICAASDGPKWLHDRAVVIRDALKAGGAI